MYETSPGWWGHGPELSALRGAGDEIGAQLWLVVMGKPAPNFQLHQHNFILDLIFISPPQLL